MHSTSIATTWGISSALFLEVYISLCVVAAIAAMAARRDPQSGRVGHNDPLPDLSPYKLAMLSGGRQLAITAAAAKLHTDGLLQSASDGLQVSGTLPAGADRLERAVFETVQHEPGISPRELREEIAEGDAMRWLAEDLTRVGLLDETRLRPLYWVWLTGMALIALGGARIAAGIANHAAVGALVIVVLIVALGALRLGSERLPVTPRGREILKRQRAARSELRHSPSVGDGAMAAALFGGGALWLAEPGFASVLDIPREDTRGGWHGGSSGGCGSGSSSSCSSGGSDGGGGGGGGCGGGGCGGGGS